MKTSNLLVLILTCLTAPALAFNRTACNCIPCEKILVAENQTWNALLNSVLETKNISTSLDSNCNLRFYLPQKYKLSSEEKEFTSADAYVNHLVTDALKNNLYAVAIKPEAFNAHLNNIQAFEQMTKKLNSALLKIKHLKKIIDENDCLPSDDHEISTKRKGKNKNQRKLVEDSNSSNGTRHQTKKHKIIKKKKSELPIPVPLNETMQGDSPYETENENEILDADEIDFEEDENYFDLNNDEDNEDYKNSFRPAVPIEPRSKFNINPQLLNSIMAVGKYGNHLEPDEVNKKLDRLTK